MYARSGRRVIGILFSLGLLALPVAAEVSVIPGPSGAPTTIVMTITDHPDPINVGAWMQVRPENTGLALNPDGFDRGDGRPDFDVNRGNAFPQVVWAYKVGPDYDIAFAEWLGTSWSIPVFLTSSIYDEQDPRIVVAGDDTSHVVWWDQTAGNDTVYLIDRHADNTWGMPIAVSEPNESARRPSVILFRQQLQIAYERDITGGDSSGQEVVVAWHDGNGGFTRQVIASTPRTDRLDVILHTNGQFAWVDWKHDDGEFGHAVSDGNGWGTFSTIIWEDPSWMGVLETRDQIEQLIP